jgi:hypothetical protein
MDEIKKAQLKGRLLDSDIRLLKDVCLCYGIQCNTDQPAEIVEALLQAVNEGKVDLIALERIANFMKECGEFFISLGKAQLMELLGIPASRYKSMKLDELKNTLLRKVAGDELKLESIALPMKKEAVKKALKPLEKDPSLLGSLVSTIHGTEILISTLDDAVSAGEAAIQKGRLNLKDLIALVEKIKRDRESAEKKRDLQLLRGDLKEIKKDIEDIKNDMKKGVRWKPSQEFPGGLSFWLRKLRLAQSRVSDSSEKRIDALLMEMEREGLKRDDLLEIAMIILSIYNLDELLSKLHLSFPDEDFYRALEEVVQQKEMFTPHLVIRDIAKELEKKFGLTREEFSRQLSEVADKGWVRFIDGAPLNHDPDDWFEYKTRKYYYMKLDRSSGR